MRLLLALAALLIAAATLWYVRRPHDREYTWTEPDDGVQPFDPRTAATGLYAA